MFVICYVSSSAACVSTAAVSSLGQPLGPGSYGITACFVWVDLRYVGGHLKMNRLIFILYAKPLVAFADIIKMDTYLGRVF